MFLPILPPPARSAAMTVVARGPLPSRLRHAALCLGNFDGLHRGHRSLIALAQALAGQQGLPMALMSCEPHPRSFFAPAGQAPFRLASPDQKRRLFDASGADYLFEPLFDNAFAAQSPETFLQDVLRTQLDVGTIICGSDFRFGAGRRGDAESVLRFASRHGIGARIVEKTIAVSSTVIRSALATGEIAEANRFLGRPWQIDLTAVGQQIRPPAGHYLVRNPDSCATFSLSLPASDDACARHGRFLDLLDRL